MAGKRSAGKDRDIVCCVCKKRMIIGHGLTSVLKDYSHCAECLEKKDDKLESMNENI